MDFFAFLILKTILTMVAFKIYSDIVGTKGDNVAAAVLFDVGYYTKAEFKGLQLSMKQWQYKLLQKLDHCLLKQLPGCRSPNGGRPFPSSSLAGQPALALHWPVRRQEVQELKV